MVYCHRAAGGRQRRTSRSVICFASRQLKLVTRPELHQRVGGYDQAPFYAIFLWQDNLALVTRLRLVTH